MIDSINPGQMNIPMGLAIVLMPRVSIENSSEVLVQTPKHCVSLISFFSKVKIDDLEKLSPMNWPN